MSYSYRIDRPLLLVVMLVLLSIMMLPDVTPAKDGDSGRSRGRDSRSDDRGSGGRDSRGSRSDDRSSGGREIRDSRSGGSGHREFRDSRFRHDRFYPARGQFVHALPHDHRVIIHGRSRFFFSAGIWYQPFGSSFVIIAPPIGVFVPVLPPYYTTVWFGGVPYYYANEAYYTHHGTGYVVVEPPQQEPSVSPPPADQMFIYPRLGQTEQQQADDRYACHTWSAGQTGYDPTQPGAGGSESQRIEKRADYQRAMAACLDGRGYTVK